VAVDQGRDDPAGPKDTDDDHGDEGGDGGAAAERATTTPCFYLGKNKKRKETSGVQDVVEKHQSCHLAEGLNEKVYILK